MAHTHGNCVHWTRESEVHVLCEKETGSACWYSKHGKKGRCTHWAPRVKEEHLKVLMLVADFYDGSKTPFSVIASCSDGNRYSVQPSHITQARTAGWTRTDYRYTENGIAFYQQQWHGDPMNIVVVEESRVG